MVVLVTGANGQLGRALQFIAGNHPEIEFVFCSSQQLNITDTKSVAAVFEQYQPDYCINAAAYTAVDKAESEPENAFLVNVNGAKNLAETCKDFGTVMIHISTDFVFDGDSRQPYTEDDTPSPTGIYGQTKLDGEKAVQQTFAQYFIIRTSWVYSQFGNNFMKTMLRLGSERDTLSVVNDQIGTPTNAVDLAEALVSIIEYSAEHTTNLNLFGTYNFSNEGSCSWYDFAGEIFKNNAVTIDLRAIATTAYPTPAKRPKYSVLDKSKIKKAFGITISDWRESLKKNQSI